jgi:hypothetical protein
MDEPAAVGQLVISLLAILPAGNAPFAEAGVGVGMVPARLVFAFDTGLAEGLVGPCHFRFLCCVCSFPLMQSRGVSLFAH